MPHELRVLDALRMGTTEPYMTFGFLREEPTLTDDLGPKPEPEIEPGEPNPGGVDAIDADDAPPDACPT